MAAFKGPKTFDPTRAQQLLASDQQADKHKKSSDRNEQLRALGFEDDMAQPGDDDHSDDSDDEDHSYEPYAHVAVPAARHVPGGAGSEQMEHLRMQLQQALSDKQQLQSAVANLERRVYLDEERKQGTIAALKAAEDQVLMLKTSSAQQLSMLKRERELLAKNGALQSANGETDGGHGAGGGGSTLNAAQLRRLEELEAENARLRQHGSASVGVAASQSAPAASTAELSQLQEVVQQQEGTIASLKKKNQDLMSNQHTAGQLQAEQNGNQQERERDLDAAHKEVEKLKVELAGASGATTKMQEQAAQIKQLQAECAALQQQLEATQAEMNQFAPAKKKLEQQLHEMAQSVGRAGEEREAALAEAAKHKAAAEGNLEEMRHLRAETEAMSLKYRKELKLRKSLHNQLADLKGQIRVFCRVRPLSEKESAKCSGEVAVTFPEEDVLVLASSSGDKSYEFDRVYNPQSTQESVFVDTEPLVTSVLDGYNVCIFAYGQTGSGKTHTMEGPTTDPGVNARALAELFRLVDERQDSETIIISASLLEIYNESIRDLLVTNAKDSKLDIRQGNDGVYVPDLTIAEVNGMDGVHKMIAVGKKNRTTFATNMNEHSSRSHSILSIYVTATNKVSGAVSKGKLHLVDLAGSERISKTDATGDRLKEAQAINKSLSALGDVIAALTSKSAHVPYRNSKLTYLLQDSLGGDSKTMMFVNINPAPENIQESTCSLNFAQRVRSVELGTASKHVSGAQNSPGLKTRPQSTSSLRRQSMNPGGV